VVLSVELEGCSELSEGVTRHTLGFRAGALRTLMNELEVCVSQ
jgi:hypothetical protein